MSCHSTQKMVGNRRGMGVRVCVFSRQSKCVYRGRLHFEVAFPAMTWAQNYGRRCALERASCVYVCQVYCCWFVSMDATLLGCFGRNITIETVTWKHLEACFRVLRRQRCSSPARRNALAVGGLFLSRTCSASGGSVFGGGSSSSSSSSETR